MNPKRVKVSWNFQAPRSESDGSSEASGDAIPWLL